AEQADHFALFDLEGEVVNHLARTEALLEAACGEHQRVELAAAGCRDKSSAGAALAGFAGALDALVAAAGLLAGAAFFFGCRIMCTWPPTPPSPTIIPVSVL